MSALIPPESSGLLDDREVIVVEEKNLRVVVYASVLRASARRNAFEA